MKMQSILLALLTLALVAVVGCDIEEAVKDEADTDFDENGEAELPPLTVEEAPIQTKAYIETCGQYTVALALADAGIDASDLDIENVSLNFLQLSYRNATWTPADITSLSCQVTFGGAATGMVTVAETAVNGAAMDWTEISIADNVKDVITYYLNHRAEVFDYCASCSDEPESWYVEFLLKLGFRVQGEVNI